MISCGLLVLCAIEPERRALSKIPAFIQNDRSIVLAMTGMRAVRLSRIAEEYKPERVLMAGLAGALSPELAIGDVMRERIHTSRELVATAREKKELFERTGCVAVDMETDLVRAWAEKIGAAFQVVRAISDRADESLDRRIMGLVDGDGVPRVGRAISLCLRSPSMVPKLLRLKRNTDYALAQLCRAVEEMIASGAWKR